MKATESTNRPVLPATDGHAPEAIRPSRAPSPKFRLEERDWLRHRLSIATAMLFAWTIGLLPRVPRDWVGDRIGDVWRLFAPTYRANVRANLTQAMGLAETDPALDGLMRDVFRRNARNFTDLFRMLHLRRDDFERLVRVAEGGWSTLEGELARGKGIVLVTGHLGAFDMVGHAIGARDHPLTALTGRTTTRFIFDAVNHLRAGHNVTIVEATPSGVRKVIQALRRNELAVFVADYDFFQNGLPVTLFGRATTLPPGPVRIARDTGAPVLGAFAQRTASGYDLSFMPPFTVPKTRDLEADLALGMAKLTEMLERAIAAMPEQWVILQRVWPETPAEPVRVFPVGSPLESEFLKRVDELLPPPRSGDGARGD
ncbi:MAG: lysophospholipid acyltransferase family protein [Thermomicrobiales bacterium]|nr:lysophospholipid acyltransferase family protein [Thermomicrobiales bacterium]